MTDSIAAAPPLPRDRYLIAAHDLTLRVYCRDCATGDPNDFVGSWFSSQGAQAPFERVLASVQAHEAECHTGSPEVAEPDRYWTIWTADRRELLGQVAGPGLVDADAALRQATTKPYDYEHTKANSYVEETDETGFNLLGDWDSLTEDEKAELRPTT